MRVDLDRRQLAKLAKFADEHELPRGVYAMDEPRFGFGAVLVIAQHDASVCVVLEPESDDAGAPCEAPASETHERDEPGRDGGSVTR